LVLGGGKSSMLGESAAVPMGWRESSWFAVAKTELGSHHPAPLALKKG
jgi:hypothetical protein